MGLLDFFRRRFDESPQPVTTGTGVAETSTRPDGEVAGSTDEPVNTGTVNTGTADRSSGTVSAAPAWSMLPAMRTVSSPVIARSFDTDMGQRLRAHRSADDLLASRSLGHTVSPSSIGVVGGLATVVSRSSALPTHSAGGDQVLRRRVLRRSELAEADRAHPRWPVVARSLEGSTGSGTELTDWSGGDEEVPDDVVGGSGPFGSPSETRYAGPDLAGVRSASVGSAASSINRQTSSDAANAGGAAPALTGGRSSSLPDRVLPVASSLGFSAPISRLNDGHSTALTASIARTFATPVAAGDPSGTRSVVSRSAPGLSTEPDPGQVDGSTVARSADTQALARTLRRRSIVEMPSGSSLFPSTVSDNRATDDDSPSVMPASGNSSASVGDGASTRGSSVFRSSDGEPVSTGTSTGEPGESAASVPTLGRRAGVGAPLSALPPTAVLRSPADADESLPPWERTMAGVMPLLTQGPKSSDHRAGAVMEPTAPGSRSTGSSPLSLQRAVAADGAHPASSGPFGHSAYPSVTGVANSVLPGPVNALLPTLAVVSRLSDQPSNSAADALYSAGGPAANETPGPGNGAGGDGPVRALLGDQESMVSMETVSPMGMVSVHHDAEPPPPGPVPVLRMVEPFGASLSARLPSSFPTKIGAPGGGPANGLVNARSSNEGTGGSGSTGRGSASMLARTLAQPAADTSGNDAMPRLNSASSVQRFAIDAAPVPMLLRSGSSPGFAAAARTPTGGNSPHALSVGSPTVSAGAANASSAGFSWTTDAYDVLQREADGDSGGAGTPTPPAAAESGPAPMAAGAPAGASSTQAEADLELLAGRLYERLRSRFRRELLDDRERAGLVLDRVR